MRPTVVLVAAFVGSKVRKTDTLTTGSVSRHLTIRDLSGNPNLSIPSNTLPAALQELYVEWVRSGKRYS